MRINEDAPRRIRRKELEGCFGTGSNDGSKRNAMARAGARIERHASQKGTRHAGLKKFAPDEVALLVVVHGKFHAIVRDSRAPHPLLEKPLHGMAAFEIHGRGHDRFDFMLQLLS